MTPKKSVLTAAMVGAFVLGATACGSDGGHFEGKEPQEIAEAARASMTDLDSLSMSSDISGQNGMTGETESIKLNASIAGNGDCEGSVALGEAEADFMSVDGTGYFKANDAFWSEEGMDGSEINSQIGDSWVASPEGQDMFGAQFCDLDSFLEDLASGEGDSGEWESIDSDSIDGTATVGVRKTDDTGSTDIFVADSEDAHILKMVRDGDEEEGTVTFSDFNKEFDFSAPSDTVNADELG
ncbi:MULTISPECIES: hypothetical protein [Streptomyces]|uniref:hypothetical protein n=1 Tax=Streptomyces TaxID=1883 RepID=UPI000CD4FB15|nr:MULTISPECIES: hypothetical protein [Streptomyces]